MLKVLAIIPCPYVSGLQIMTLRFFERLSTRIDSHFLITRWTDGKFSQQLAELAIPYTYSWLGMFSRKLDWVNLHMTIHCLSKIPQLYWDFLRLVRSYRPDVIYAGNYHELILLWPVLLRQRIPLIYHVHNPLPAGPFYRRTFFFWRRVVNHYIGVSNSVTSSILNLGVDQNHISLLYNGVDLSRFQNPGRRSDYFCKKYGWSDESVIIGMTGQMSEAKGHLDLLEAMTLVRKEHPEVHLVIGGKQEEPFFQRLKKQVAIDNLSEIAAFSGWQDDMRSFYKGIDVFVLPSRQDTEGLPLVIAEAMAAGLPIVSTRSGGASEIVKDGETGFLVERQSPRQLAEAIRSLVTSPPSRIFMGRAGRQRVEAYFDLSKQAAQLETVLETIANSKGK
jgi:glycosyltransferase involved in cell wall biosynthesis